MTSCKHEYLRVSYNGKTGKKQMHTLTQAHTIVQGDRADADLKLSVESTLVRQVTLLYFLYLLYWY